MILSKRKKSLTHSIFLTSLLLIPTTLFAASDDSYDDGDMVAQGGESAEQKAVSAYNHGMKQLDKAQGYAAESKAVNEAKKKKKLAKKSHKYYSKSTKSFKRAVKNNPELYQAYSSLGFALRKIGNLDESLSNYKKSLEINPNYYPAIEYLAETHLQLRQYAKVQSAYKRLSQEEPKYAKKLVDAIVDWQLSEGKDSDSDIELEAFNQWFSSVEPQV